MSRIKTAVALVGVFLLAWAAQPLVAADRADVKKLMGDNFQLMQDILEGLLTAHYDNLPGDVAVIRDHASALSSNVPQSVPQESRRTFVTYAYTLEQKSENLITVLAELIKHEKQRTDPAALNIDYLRAVAASEFGEVVTTCVLCHNQFRRRTVP